MDDHDGKNYDTNLVVCDESQPNSELNRYTTLTATSTTSTSRQRNTGYDCNHPQVPSSVVEVPFEKIHADSRSPRRTLPSVPATCHTHEYTASEDSTRMEDQLEPMWSSDVAMSLGQIRTQRHELDSQKEHCVTIQGSPSDDVTQSISEQRLGSSTKLPHNIPIADQVMQSSLDEEDNQSNSHRSSQQRKRNISHSRSHSETSLMKSFSESHDKYYVCMGSPSSQDGKQHALSSRKSIFSGHTVHGSLELINDSTKPKHEGGDYEDIENASVASAPAGRLEQQITATNSEAMSNDTESLSETRRSSSSQFSEMQSDCSESPLVAAEKFALEHYGMSDDDSRRSDTYFSARHGSSLVDITSWQEDVNKAVENSSKILQNKSTPCTTTLPSGILVTKEPPILSQTNTDVSLAHSKISSTQPLHEMIDSKSDTVPALSKTGVLNKDLTVSGQILATTQGRELDIPEPHVFVGKAAPWSKLRNREGEVESSVTPEKRKEISKAAAEQGQHKEEEEEAWWETHWRMIFISILIAVIAAIGIIFRLFSPNSTIADASVAAWSLLLVCLAVLIPSLTALIRFVSWALMVLVFSRGKRSQVVSYYLRSLRNAVVWFLWSICAVITWHVIFGTDFFPPARAPGSRIQTTKFLWWIDRILWCVIVVGAFGIVRQYVSKSVALKRRAESYHQRVRQVVKADQLLTLLSRPIPPKMLTLKFRPPIKRKPRRGPRVTFTVPQRTPRASISSNGSEISSDDPSASIATPSGIETDLTESMSRSAIQAEQAEQLHPESSSQTILERSQEKENKGMLNEGSRTTSRLWRWAVEKTISSSSHLPHTSNSRSVSPQDEQPIPSNQQQDRKRIEEHIPPKTNITVENLNEVSQDSNLSDKPLPRVTAMGVPGVMLQERIKPKVSIYKLDIDKLFLDAEAIQREPLWVCKKQRAIRTFKVVQVNVALNVVLILSIQPQDARALGSALFEFYTQFASGSKLDKPLDMLPISLLKQALSHHPATRAQVEALLDLTGSKELSREHLMSRCTELFLERKNLANTLSDLDSIITAIDSFLLYVNAIIFLLALLVVFSSGDFSDITITAGSTILALSFIFADTCKHTFNSFVFLFSRHPFDSGDRVQIGGIAPALYVQKMELLNTTFTMWDGTITTIPNHILYQRDIYNIQRSGMMWDILELHVDYRTSNEKINELEASFRKCLRNHPTDFDDSNSFFLLSSLADMSRLTLSLISAHRTNWQNGEHVFRRSLLLKHLKVACEELGIQYYPPVQRTEITQVPPFVLNQSNHQTGSVGVPPFGGFYPPPNSQPPQ